MLAAVTMLVASFGGLVSVGTHLMGGERLFAWDAIRRLQGVLPDHLVGCGWRLRLLRLGTRLQVRGPVSFFPGVVTRGCRVPVGSRGRRSACRVSEKWGT